MSDKKLTPLQEAIKELKVKSESSKYTMQEQAGLDKAIDVLESLLPKEKEFAREMWMGGWSKGFQDGENRDDEDDIVGKPDFPELYKQYKP